MRNNRGTIAAIVLLLIGCAHYHDPRVGLRAGLWDAGSAAWNLRLVSSTRSPEPFSEHWNSDLAFQGPYVIQGNYYGYQVWDISTPSHPTLKTAYVCPGSQSDVSTYKNLLFESTESLSARRDCAASGVPDTVSPARMRGIRIYDITDIVHPKHVADVQTCRGSHTHSLLVDPRDPDDVYIYVSGAAHVRSPNELSGCAATEPSDDPHSALFRIEIIKVPLLHPDQAAIVSSPRIFAELTTARRHGGTVAERATIAEAKGHGAFTIVLLNGQEYVLGSAFIDPMLDSIARARGGTGPTAADSATLRAALPAMFAPVDTISGNKRLGTSCHDITVYPAIRLAAGACEGHGLLLDINDPAHPVRLDAVADTNFSYWHSATFNNDGTKVLFSDEWGGGTQPKCRSTDPKEWGADAIFAIVNRRLVFQGYYKLPAAQTANENCVAHNGSLIPIPGRDVMVQGWYQGGVSVFDWTDPGHAREIAFFDRGPVDKDRLVVAGSWSAYWYNGVIVSSEMMRGLDILELTPSAWLSQHEIDAARSVQIAAFNAQGQPAFVWPPSFALAGAYLDQLEREHGLSNDRIRAARAALSRAQGVAGDRRREGLTQLAGQLEAQAASAVDGAKVRTLAKTARELAESGAT
jgi:hypothetical protein